MVFTWLKKHQNKLVLGLIFGLFIATRLPYFCSGLLPLEPDEQEHQSWAQDIKAKRWPILKGRPYSEQVPLFSYVASFVPSKNYCPFFEVRTVSFISSLIVLIVLALLSNSLTLLVFTLSPLTMFYSKTGVLDMAMMAGLVLSFYFLLKPKKLNYFYSGLFFGLAVMFKTAALYFALVFLFEFLYQSSKQKLVKNIKQFSWAFFGFLSLSVPIFSIFFYFFKRFNPTTPHELFNVPQMHFLPLTNLTVHLAVIWEYLKQSPYLLGILMPLYLISLIISLKHIKKPLVRLTLWGSVATLIFLSLFKFSPRYLLYLSPWLALTIGLAVNLKPKLKQIFFLSLIALLPLTYQAFKSADHQAFETISSWIQSQPELSQKTNIFTSYLPEKVELIFNKPATWLDLTEVKPGDLILIEELRSRDFASFGPKPNLKIDMETIRSQLTPIYVINETTPNFPYTHENNSLELYLY